MTLMYFMGDKWLNYVPKVIRVFENCSFNHFEFIFMILFVPFIPLTNTFFTHSRDIHQPGPKQLIKNPKLGNLE